MDETKSCSTKVKLFRDRFFLYWMTKLSIEWSRRICFLRTLAKQNFSQSIRLRDDNCQYNVRISYIVFFVCVMQIVDK